MYLSDSLSLKEGREAVAAITVTMLA